MKIVIDCRFWTEAGIGRYLRNLVAELQILDHRNQYILLCLAKDLPLIPAADNFSKIKAYFKWYGLSEQIKLPLLLDQLKPDLVHFPHFNVPIFYKGKYVVTIHDLIHQHFQMQRATTRDLFTYRIKTYGYKKVFAHAVNSSFKIMTPSLFVKNQLVNEWKVPKEKIIITPEGVEESLMELQGGDEGYEGYGEYIYYVGNAHPHKNIESLTQVFARIRQEHPELKLVLSGPDNYFWQRLKKEKNSDGIIFTGFVSEKEMVSLYKNALCFVTPSLEEGFGIPVLEAMALSCPVVSSQAGSLKEVGGEAALYFDPLNKEQMYKQLTRVINNPALRKKLIERGKKRIKEFSWKKMAEQTLEVYLQ